MKTDYQIMKDIVESGFAGFVSVGGHFFYKVDKVFFSKVFEVAVFSF